MSECHIGKLYYTMQILLVEYKIQYIYLIQQQLSNQLSLTCNDNLCCVLCNWGKQNSNLTCLEGESSTGHN